MAVLTRHLHAAVKEIEPTEAEWFEAIRFLTATGHMCTDWRQEFILLSDTLGVSMLVDAINNRKPSGASESTVLGPFHVADAPELPMGSTSAWTRRANRCGARAIRSIPTAPACGGQDRCLAGQ
jgi:hydroxyquinol 1,2-dioxygenase